MDIQVDVIDSILSSCANIELIEEFGIYLNYVRKLGFEETPDYDFLRELFTKIIRTNGDIEDGVYDWNMINGISLFPFVSQHLNSNRRGSRVGSLGGLFSYR